MNKIISEIEVALSYLDSIDCNDFLHKKENQIKLNKAYDVLDSLLNKCRKVIKKNERA